MKRLLFTTILCAATGCGSPDAIDVRESVETSSRGANETIEFDNRTWLLQGPCRPSSFFRVGATMSCVYYTCGQSNLRLIEMKADDSMPRRETVYSRILHVQSNRAGRWKNDGPSKHWLVKGGRGESNYRNGQMHGSQVEWHANGQLILEREWADGKMHGSERGWWENGNKKYVVVNVNDEEVSGRTWSKDGTPNQ